MAPAEFRPRGRLSLALPLAATWLLALRASLPAGELGKKSLSGVPIKVLGDRLRVRMPAGGKLEARRARRIMGAPPSSDEEARLVYETGDEKLVVMVHETFETAGDDIDRKVSGRIEGWSEGEGGPRFHARPLEFPARGKEKGLKGFLAVPDRLEVKGESARARCAFLVLPDGTVLYLVVHVNPEAARDPEGCGRLAEEIIGSAQPGAGKLPTAAGTRRLPLYPPKDAVSVDVPEGFIVTCQTGVDFFIYHLRALRPFGSDRPGGGLALYCGNHPKLRPDGKDDGATTEKARLLGRDVTWTRWEEPGEGGAAEEMAETLIPTILSDYPFMVVHVILHAPDTHEMERLRLIAETLRLVPRGDAPASTGPKRDP